MKMMPINTDNDGCSKTVLAGYYKYGCKTLLGDNYGTTGTAVLYEYEEETDKCG